MKRNILVVVLCVFLVVIVGAGFLGYRQYKASEQSVYAIVMKSGGNIYNEKQAMGFVEVIEAAGNTTIVSYPETTTAEDQIQIINGLIAKNVDGIAIAANDYDALESVLEKALEKGIHVISFDANVDSDSRETFVNQAEVHEVGEVLMDAVLDISQGEGQWAILSTTAQASNQNAWIEAMKDIMVDDKYGELKLVEVEYGEDDYETSKEKVRELLEEYPDLTVICAPTTVGIMAAAEVLKEENSTCKLTGLGLPSEMADYIGEENVCPYMYLWSPIDVGMLSAYTLLALESGDITGQAGEVFVAGELGTYEIIESTDGGTEIIVGPPLKFDESNIAEWETCF